MARKVIRIPGSWHGGQPIPPATKTGPIVTSGGIYGLDPETDKIAEDLKKQVELCFEHVRRIMQEAGGSPDDIAHVTVYVKNRDARPLVNEEWVKMFPDEDSRPTRHTIQYEGLAPGMELQLQFTAYVGS